MMEYQIKNENEWRASELELAYKQLAASMRAVDMAVGMKIPLILNMNRIWLTRTII